MVTQHISTVTKVQLLIGVNLLLMFLFCISLFTFPVSAVVGEDNVTVITLLQVGTVAPEVLNVSIEEDAATFDLTPNTGTLLSCVARIRDFNNESDFDAVNATFFHNSVSITDPDDNNTHYTNVSCAVNTSFVNWEGHADDIYSALANCTFQVQYYANPGEWNCTVSVNDSVGLEASGTDNISINQLLALELPDTINYGTVNATDVSSENITNVSNVGNVEINLSLYGYAFNNETTGENYSMNCTAGSVGTIPIYYEKYNLTATNPGTLSLSQFEGVYANLSSSAVVREFNLNSRQNDALNDAINATHWRMYVPVGVAGNCSGSIVFGATQAAGAPYP